MNRRSVSAAAESVLAFWAEAGVDATLLETPVDRIAEGQRPLAPRAAAPTPLRPQAAAAPRPLAIDAAKAAAAACMASVTRASSKNSSPRCPIRFEG